MAKNDILFRPSTEEVVVQSWGKAPYPLQVEQQNADIISLTILSSFMLVMIILRYHRPAFQVAWKDFFFSKNIKLMTQTDQNREKKLRIVMTLLISLQGVIATIVYAPNNLLLTTSRSVWKVFCLYTFVFMGYFCFKQLYFQEEG